MKRLTLLLALVLGFAFSCTKTDKSGNVPDWRKYTDTTGQDTPKADTSILDYPNRTKPLLCSDLVLIYGGSQHRQPVNWNQYTLDPYVTYTNTEGKTSWLFDGFLCLEFMLTQYDRTLVTGYSYNGHYLNSANQAQWESLANYYFINGMGLDALEASVKNAAKTLGNPPYKRRVYIGLPEPIRDFDSHNETGGTQYWGKVDGRTLDFSLTADRITAVVWFIDKVRENFKKKNYQYIELAGFYWVAEKSTNSADIIAKIANYLHPMNYAFTWIPYYKAQGYNLWKSYGFDLAYMQPNYFFADNIPYSRLTDACRAVKDAGLKGMEVEFDGAAYEKGGGTWAYRLYDYLNAFKDEGIWKDYYLAYYQGSWALSWLKGSTNANDQKLYHYFCDWVVSRPLRDQIE